MQRDPQSKATWISIDMLKIATDHEVNQAGLKHSATDLFVHFYHNIYPRSKVFPVCSVYIRPLQINFLFLVLGWLPYACGRAVHC